MIALLISVSEAFGQAFVVGTTVDSINPLDGVLSLREAAVLAGPGDSINFSTAVFPTGIVTAIPMVLGTLVLPQDTVWLRGEGRVALDGAGAPPGSSGIEVADSFMLVTGMEVRNFPVHGIVVSFGTETRIGGINADEPNYVHDNGQAGIHVGDAVTPVQLTRVEYNVVDANCQNPGGFCAGIEVFGPAPMGGLLVKYNTVTGTAGDPALSQGAGILLGSGSGHLVQGNTVGGSLADCNAGHGVHVQGGGAVGLMVQADVVDNVVSGNGRAGIFLGERSAPCSVSDNLVGTDATGEVAVPNAGPGIAVFATDSQVVSGNVVSGNTGVGIRLSGSFNGDWQSNHTIEDNLVGTDDDGESAIPNGLHGIHASGLGGSTAIRDNVVSGNTQHGILIDEPTDTVQGNRVGTNAAGTVAIPNGTGAGGPWAGIVVRGLNNTVGGDLFGVTATTLGKANQVSGNAGDGIRLSPGSFETEVAGNLVGATNDGNGILGNEGHGIVVSADGVLIGTNLAANVVLDNGGDGIRLESTFAEVHSVAVQHNMVGQGMLGTIHGNDGDGIAAIETVFPLRDVDINDNWIRQSGGVGIRLDGGDRITLSTNRVRASDECAILLENGANGMPAAPTLEFRSATTLIGSFAVPVGLTALAVEVFWDREDEAWSYLGNATLTGSQWELQADSEGIHPFPSGGRVGAIVLLSDGSSSGLGAACGDGCSSPGTGTCEDGNPCTAEVCDAVAGCVVSDDDGAICSDGDSCTLGDVCADGICFSGAELPGGCGGFARCTETDPASGLTIQKDCSDADLCEQDRCDITTGDCIHGGGGKVVCGDDEQCTADRCDPAYGCENFMRPNGFGCNDDDACTGLGHCDGAGACAPGETFTCPGLSCSNTGSCAPAVGCSYSFSCNDGICGTDDLCDCNGAGQDCSPTAMPDDDGDGLPNAWEAVGLDTNCDGVPDYPLDSDINRPTVLLEIDYMVDVDHTHEPLPEVMDQLQAAFDTQDLLDPYELIVDVDEALEHFEGLGFGSNPPNENTCESWTDYHQVKRAHFDWVRRPAWRYAVFAHKVVLTPGQAGNEEQPRQCTAHSGLAQGGEVIVSLGSFPDQVGPLEAQAGVLHHEIGHTLGLDGHKGPAGAGSQAFYQSSMNYLYVGTGLEQWDPVSELPTGVFVADYSHEALDFDEEHLDETVGIDSSNADDKLYVSTWVCPTTDYCLDLGIPLNDDGECQRVDAAPIGPVDWDCDGVAEVDVEVNLDASAVTEQTTGRDDWAGLDLHFQCMDGYAQAPILAAPDEPTYEALVAKNAAYPTLRPPLDPMPSCTLDPIAEDGTGEVQVAILGSASVDVADVLAASVRVSGATPTASSTLDLEADGDDDLVVEVDAADLLNVPPNDLLVVVAQTVSDRRVESYVRFSWVATALDADADGVDDRCDLCPTQAGPAASPDGCP